jgi:hypothetical protein
VPGHRDVPDREQGQYGADGQERRPAIWPDPAGLARCRQVGGSKRTESADAKSDVRQI